MYKAIARQYDAPFRDFNYAANAFGRDTAFQGACRELLETIARSQRSPLFNAVLIDEAQDLPPEFFKLVYQVTAEPKRIVWAYDELQNLSEEQMPTTTELFGTTEEGDDLVRLANTDGQAAQDIVLPICYRNSPWALATAHALGFGVYREGGLVQYFDDPVLWQRIGYRVAAGTITAGRDVSLDRSPDSYPQYFIELLNPDDAVLLKAFSSASQEDAWIAEQIGINLHEDELECDDILVVLPDAYTSKRRATRLSAALANLDINSHLVGVASSVDEVFVGDSIAIAHIYRAKGNEAPMVYVVDAQYATGQGNAVSRRNTIFTAITRSRAWVRICGWGERMIAVEDEVNKTRDHRFSLQFKVPTNKQLATMRRIHRERSDAEVHKIEKVTRSFEEMIELLDKGEIELAELPPRVRAQIVRLAQSTNSDPDDDE